MLIIATSVTIVASMLGIYASFFIGSAPAPTIILIMTAAFVFAFIRAGVQKRNSQTQAEDDHDTDRAESTVL